MRGPKKMCLRCFISHSIYAVSVRLVTRFDVIDYMLKVLQEPQRFHATEMISQDGWKQRLALWVVKRAYWLCPRYIWLLRRTGESGSVA